MCGCHGDILMSLTRLLMAVIVIVVVFNDGVMCDGHYDGH